MIVLNLSTFQAPDLVAHLASLDLKGLYDRELALAGIIGMRQLAHAQVADLEKAGISRVAAASILAVSSLLEYTSTENKFLFEILAPS